MIADTSVTANVYPVDNVCFLNGITEILKNIESRLYIPLSVVWSEYTFIDLSAYTMRHLIENETYWLENLKDKKVIFITGRNLGALANYWFFNSNVFGVIYLDYINNIEKSLTYVINGRFLRKDIKYNNVTKREMQILKKLSQGLPPKIIARTENCSVKTIYSHRKNILDKLNVLLV